MHYILYHPERIRVTFSRSAIERHLPELRIVPEDAASLTVHCDSFGGNQDPYIWGGSFLHSFCKINEISVKKLRPGDTLIWLTPQHLTIADRQQNAETACSRDYVSWVCDLVFVVDEVCYWKPGAKAEGFRSSEYFIEEFEYNHYNIFEMTGLYEKLKDENSFMQRFRHHFSWPALPEDPHRKYKGKKAPHPRATLRANADSYQPLDRNGNLVSMAGCLAELEKRLGYPPVAKGKRRIELSECQKDYVIDYIERRCALKLKGVHFATLSQIPWQQTTANLTKDKNPMDMVSAIQANGCRELITPDD